MSDKEKTNNETNNPETEELTTETVDEEVTVEAEATVEEEKPEEPKEAETETKDKKEKSVDEKIPEEDQTEEPPEVEEEYVLEPPIADDIIKTVTLEELEALTITDSPTESDMEELYNQSLHDISEGDVTEGRVLAVNDNEAIVDIGFKSEGIVPIEDFNRGELPQVGETIEVFLEKLEDETGQLVLSKKKADFMRIWDRILEGYNNDEIFEGRILRRVKGGMIVDLLGLDAFLPGSQIDIKPIQDFDQFVGNSYEFKIVKLNEARKNIVVSRRELIEEDLKEKRMEVLSGIEVDQVMKGRVKNITDFGVFVDLGGVDGLLHITDLSWGRVNHPSEVVSIDEEIEVTILNYNDENGRISLGYKQLQPHPWENIEKRFPVDTTVTGQVVSITNYGAFVELEKGVEGLIHISEMSWTQHVKHPSNMLSLGEEVEARVLKVLPDDKKISLGLKQLTPDPWENIEEKYQVGTIHSGVVRNLTQFGCFVELEEGVEGLVHISDLSWTKKVRHPKEVVKKGEEIEVMVLDISRDNRRISLGYKQVGEDPWPLFEEKYGLGQITEGTIVKVLDKGVTVDLPEGGEGFVPLSKLTGHRVRRASEIVEEGETLNLKVIEFSKEDKKIVLSYLEYLEDSGEEEPSDRLELARKSRAEKAEEAAAVETGEESSEKGSPKEEELDTEESGDKKGEDGTDLTSSEEVEKSESSEDDAAVETGEESSEKGSPKEEELDTEESGDKKGEDGTDLTSSEEVEKSESSEEESESASTEENVDKESADEEAEAKETD